MNRDEYQLLDSGDGRKLERFGAYVIDRPCAQAVWRPVLASSEWSRSDARFLRAESNTWEFRRDVPEWWVATVNGLRFRVSPTDFGHLGVFPEHGRCWDWLRGHIAGGWAEGDKPEVLNLFAYTGGATLAAASAGSSVCHLDASRKTVSWARENASLNGLESASVRWIVDDVRKFLKREVRRKRKYAGIILDPPSYGRGKRQELFKITDHLVTLMELCAELLTSDSPFVFFSCHTPGYTPLVLQNLLRQVFGPGRLDSGEMVLEGNGNGFSVPSGSYSAWSGSSRPVDGGGS